MSKQEKQTIFDRMDEWDVEGLVEDYLHGIRFFDENGRSIRMKLGIALQDIYRRLKELEDSKGENK